MDVQEDEPFSLYDNNQDPSDEIKGLANKAVLPPPPVDDTVPVVNLA
jgi:hypothetical protein